MGVTEEKGKVLPPLKIIFDNVACGLEMLLMGSNSSNLSQLPNKVFSIIYQPKLDGYLLKERKKKRSQ